MTLGILILQSILLGVGLAMDAFSISVANSLAEPDMPLKKRLAIAGTFSLFQFLMPMLGWLMLSGLTSLFTSLSRFLPWVAFLILLGIGGKMILDARNADAEAEDGRPVRLSAGALLLQGIATSLDALSVGFTFYSYRLSEALASSFIIGLVTFFICLLGLFLGRSLGSRVKNAALFGGVVLIIIGIKLLLEGIL